MKRQTRRKAAKVAATITINGDGRRVALVPVRNSDSPATMDADWYEAKKAGGWSMLLRFIPDGRGFACVTMEAYTSRGQSSELAVARLVADAKAGERVRARDPLNLLPENLETYPGYAPHAAADWYPNADALRAAGGKPTREAMGMRRRKKSAALEPAKMSSEHTGSTRNVLAKISAGVSDDRTHGHHPPYPLRSHGSAQSASP